MSGKAIDQFMWGYQVSFRTSLQGRAARLLKLLGADAEVQCFLVGVQRPGAEVRHAVCVEPEQDLEHVHLFSSLADQVVEAVSDHPLKLMFYSDEATTRDQPDRIRRSAIKEQVQRLVDQADGPRGLISFVGGPWTVDSYDVLPVLQLPQSSIQAFPPLRGPTECRYTWDASMIHAALRVLLESATRELQRPEPGRMIGSGELDEEEIARRAATSFLKTPCILIDSDAVYPDIFAMLNEISTLRYESGDGIGRLLLADPANPALDFTIRFEAPVPLDRTRWTRKVLEMASGDLALVADGSVVHGLGRLDPNHDPTREDAFWIDFLEHHSWDLRLGSQVLLRSRLGQPTLPQEVIPKDRFVENCELVFGRDGRCDPERLWEVFTTLASLGRGAMLVVADDAAPEADRLSAQGTLIRPRPADRELLDAATRIDGSILIDPFGTCHAIGLILDGAANESCAPARGSRYNSAVRYVGAGSGKRLAIVLSEDRTLDILPLLRKRIAKHRLEDALRALETATLEDYHQPRRFLDENRFYLSAEQCARANAALDRLDELPLDLGKLRIITIRFQPHPDMRDAYFLEEEEEEEEGDG